MTDNMTILGPKGLEQETVRIAVSEGITVYDASYISLARRRTLTLVSENQKLAHTARKYVDVTSLDNL